MQFRQAVERYIENLPTRAPVVRLVNNDPLFESRASIFDALRKRILSLRVKTVPESYFLGQDYVECQTRIPAVIMCVFATPAHIQPFSFWHHGGHFEITWANGFVVIQLKKKISGQLWDDIRLLARGETHIVAYMSAALHRINAELLDQRYNRGHILARTASVFELQRLRVLCSGRIVSLPWPVSFLTHEESASLAHKNQDLYMRDYIDAFGLFYRNEYDDCIRRIITSTESFITDPQWKAKPPSKQSFRRKMHDNLRIDQLSGEVINDNLNDIYSVRNKIAHDGFHMSTSSYMYCSKALATLKYLIFGYSGNREKSQYAYQLHAQFVMQSGAIGELHDLDLIDKREKAVNETPKKAISTPRDLDEFMFSALRFTERDRRSIRK